MAAPRRTQTMAPPRRVDNTTKKLEPLANPGRPNALTGPVHPVAGRLYANLAAGPAARYLTSTDWDLAEVAVILLTKELAKDRPSALMIKQVMDIFDDLGATVASRARLGIEEEPTEPVDSDSLEEALRELEEWEAAEA